MTQQQVKVGIYGAGGYAGNELVEILASHPCVELVFATSSTFSGESVLNTNLTYSTPDTVNLNTVDAVFLALPHKASATVAVNALAHNVKVIDLSADFRLNTAESYEQWYQTTHPHPEMLPIPYGLPEINRANLKNIDLVAVPGCYPTTTLLGLYPLLKVDALNPAMPIIVDAKSGISGAGRTPKANTHFVEVMGNFSPYSPGRSHRHVGEIEQEIQHITSNIGTLIFTPHLLPTDRGLMASIYVTLNGDFSSADAQSLYESTYADEPLVDVLPTGQLATLRHVVRKNNCVISVTPVAEKYLHITSVTDNLRKGAASQAVQDFNLMFDFSETLALV